MSDDPPVPERPAPSGIDISVPHSARVWNYWLGGKDNYAVDRAVGDQLVALMPELPTIAREVRHFLARVVRYLAGEAGIGQFLDIGTGLPTVDNTHEVAQRVAPDSRIVYVDNDPLVLVHARALLTSTPQGATDYVDADVHDSENILAQAARTLDFERPVAVMMLGILAHVQDYNEARSIVRHLMDACPPGSYLVLHDGLRGISESHDESIRRYNEEGHGVPYRLRSKEEYARFFDGLEMVEPGLVLCRDWRPEVCEVGPPHSETAAIGGVARKPW